MVRKNPYGPIRDIEQIISWNLRLALQVISSEDCPALVGAHWVIQVIHSIWQHVFEFAVLPAHDGK